MPAAIFTPQSMKRQPMGLLRVNASHPLAAGLKLFWHGGTLDVGYTVNGPTKALVTTGATSLPAQGASSLGGAATIAADTFLSFSAQDLPYVPPPFTLIAGVRSFPANGVIFSYQGSGVGRGWLAAVIGSKVELDFGGTAAYSSGLAPGSGDLGYVVTGQGGTVRFFIDRAFAASASVGTCVAGVAGTWPVLGRIGTGSTGSGNAYPATGAQISYVALWNRALSDAEVIAYQANPYGILRRNRSVFYPGAAPVLSAATVTSVAATTAKPRATVTF